MNELIFFLHTLVVFGATFGAFLAGKHILRALACLYVVFANLFVVKKMMLGGFVASGSDMYIIGSMCAILMGRAVWGEAFAKRTAFLSVGVSVLFFMLCWFQITYLPSAADTMQPVFLDALGRMPWITFFSILAHYVSQLVTVAISSACARRCMSRGIVFWSFGAMLIGQLVDGILFFGGAFWGALTMAELIQMVAVSTGIKLVLILSSSVLVAGAVWCKERGYVQ